jgi:D-3-phosphoglycerate dehydrogenase / 2-oxoglutarate reductase
MKVLGIILARGGSKGIPKKNIKPLQGKPLIAYTIEAALKSKVFDELVISTDSEEIATIAKEFGAQVPFMRPDELAGDTVWSRDALKHAVLESEKIYGKTYDYVIELPCIAPLRNEVHIKEAYDLLAENKADSVTSVAMMGDKHPVRMKRIVDGILKDFTTEFPEGEGSRRQDLEPCYIRNGAIYAMTRDTIIEKFSRHGDGSRPYVMDDESSINIDTMLDFKLAEILIDEKSKN